MSFPALGLSDPNLKGYSRFGLYRIHEYPETGHTHCLIWAEI